MKILATYDRGVGTDSVVVLEVTGRELAALGVPQPTPGQAVDLPAILADATEAQRLADQLRAVVDRIAPTQAQARAQVG